MQLPAQAEARRHSECWICLLASPGPHSPLHPLTSPAILNLSMKHDQRREGGVYLDLRVKAGHAASCSLGPKPSRERHSQLSPLVCKAIKYAGSHLVPGKPMAPSHRR